MKEKSTDLESFLRENPKEVLNCFEKIEVIDVNRSALEHYGADSKEELIDNLTSLGAEDIDCLRKEIIAIANGKSQFRSETEAITLDGGSKKELLELKVPKEYQDDFSRVYVTITDIIKQKKAEEELRQYKKGVEASEDSIYVIDKNYRYVFANGEHLSRLEEDNRIPEQKEDEVVGKEVRDIHPDEGWKPLEKNIEKVLETRQTLKEEHKSTSTGRWSNRTYSPVENPTTGEIEGVVVVSKDVTARKKAKE